MANYDTLKAAIQDVIKTNGNNEITGALMQQSLLAMISSLGADYQFAGFAEPSTNPGTPDQKVAYIAGTVGTYSNFGGININPGEIAIFKYNGTWTNNVISLFLLLESLGIINDNKTLPNVGFLFNALCENGNYNLALASLSAIQPYALDSDGTFGASTTYKHADVLVYPGDVIRIKANASETTRVVFVTNLDCPMQNANYGMVPDTSRYSIPAGEERIFIVPNGAVALKVYMGALSGTEYQAAPEYVKIFRAKGFQITPHIIQMDKYTVSSAKLSSYSTSHGVCFPVESGKSYVLKFGSAGTGTKYFFALSGLPYFDRPVDISESPNQSFSTTDGGKTFTANADGVCLIMRNAAAFDVEIAEIKDSTIIQDDKLNAINAVLNYDEINVVSLPHISYYIASASGLWTSSSNVKCVLYPVKPGQLIKVEPNPTNDTILYWLRNNNTPVAGSYPDLVVEHRERIVIAHGEQRAVFLLVPDNAEFLYVYTGSGNANVPSFIGIASQAVNSNSQTSEITPVDDYSAFNDKQIIINENRGYYFNDDKDYINETSYIDRTYLERKILEVPEGKHFIFLSDSHIDYDNGIGIRQNDTPILKYVRDRIGIRNVIFGGDCIGSRPTKYQGAKVLSIYTKEKIDAFGRDFLFVMGNHDANVTGATEQTDVPTMLISDTEIYKRTTRHLWESKAAVFPEKLINIIATDPEIEDHTNTVLTTAQREAFIAWAKLNYYFDDNEQKIRYIILETGDAGQTIRDVFNPGNAGDGQYSLAVVAYFFVEALQTVPTGYDVVVVGHYMITTGRFWSRVFWKCIAAYKNKQSITVDFNISSTSGRTNVPAIVSKTLDNPASLASVPVSFVRGVGSGRIFCISGHVHYDRTVVRKYVADNSDIEISIFPLSTSGAPQSLTYETNSVLHILVDRCCGIGQGSAYINGTVSECYSYPNQGTGDGEVQRLGNETEILFDVVTITNDNRVVLTRFGAHGPITGEKYTRNYVLPMPIE